ncbi:Basal body-orientation factor 1 [Hondaea fermentalgiana]|uniref:Basal body-orientation factor 1 n=1 Tax=Hondaea fermentalgiana TaxID=2315210 RepID=A0A2R5G805_9STRA|nr:Basal body-orientation factor 1 [Hondaea fermentalgiana]|eukprot:GBG27120.1 Basal body-orientation factor 1 [Hondaea fermentalgiana]
MDAVADEDGDEDDEDDVDSNAEVQSRRSGQDGPMLGEMRPEDHIWGNEKDPFIVVQSLNNGVEVLGRRHVPQARVIERDLGVFVRIRGFEIICKYDLFLSEKVLQPLLAPHAGHLCPWWPHGAEVEVDTLRWNESQQCFETPHNKTNTEWKRACVGCVQLIFSGEGESCRIAQYGNGTIKTHCNTCRPVNMGTISPSLCKVCQKTAPTYGWPNNKNKTHCADCRKPGMVTVAKRLCKHVSCSKTASYGYKGQREYCAKHKESDMELGYRMCMRCKQAKATEGRNVRATHCKPCMAELEAGIVASRSQVGKAPSPGKEKQKGGKASNGDKPRIVSSKEKTDGKTFKSALVGNMIKSKAKAEGSKSGKKDKKETNGSQAETTPGKANKRSATGAKRGPSMAKKKKQAKAAATGSAKASAAPRPGSRGDSAEDALYKQSLESRVEGLKLRVEALREENLSLKEKAAKSEKDTHEFVAYFQNEIEKKDATIAKLAEESNRSEARAEEELKATRATSEAAVSKAQKELQDTKAALDAKVLALEDELELLSEYKHKRDVLNARLEAAESRAAEQAKEHQEQIHTMEREFIEKTARKQREMEMRIESIEQKAREDAQQGLDADTRKIIADNKRMGEELKFQLQTCDELQAQNKALVEENKRARRNLELASGKEEEYAARGFYKENEIHNARQKIKALERTLSQAVRDAEQRQADADSKFRKETESLNLEVAGLKQLVKLKNKELANIRKLAQVILDQRTETEQFFLEALEQVKKEVRRARVEEHHRLAAEHRKRRPQQLGIENDSHLSAPVMGNRVFIPKDFNIELRDLSWADRERVLRILFARINAVENQAGDIIRDATQAGLTGLSIVHASDSTRASGSADVSGLLAERPAAH